MEKRKGSSRVAYVFPRIGIAVKVARISNPLSIAGYAARTWRRRGWRDAWRYLSIPVAALGLSPRYVLFSGILANLREWWFYLRTRHPAAAPTYFTCGFVNVQRAVAPLPVTGDVRHPNQWWARCLCDAARVELVADLGDPHGFTYGNFGVLSGRVCCVDYPSADVQQFLLAHGDALVSVPLPS